MRSFAFRQIFAIRDRNERSPPRSSEFISNSTSADASKSNCFKGRLETVSPSESTELQRKGRSRERFWELAALQGAEVGLMMLQIPRVFSRQNRDREPFATGWWRRTQSQSNLSPLSNSLVTGKRIGNFVESARSTRFLKLTREQIQRLSAEFPTKQNRELFCGTGNSDARTGNFTCKKRNLYRMMFSVHTTPKSKMSD